MRKQQIKIWICGGVRLRSVGMFVARKRARILAIAGARNEGVVQIFRRLNHASPTVFTAY